MSFDPLHVCKLAGALLTKSAATKDNRHGRSGAAVGRWIKQTRSSLPKRPAHRTNRQLANLAEVVLTNKSMYRAFLRLVEPRHVYRFP